MNISVLTDFSMDLDYDTVCDDLTSVYKITNVYYDCENLFDLAEALKSDLDGKRANYRAYIFEGIDARLLMELRKSYILDVGRLTEEFYVGHDGLVTVDAVKDWRIRFFIQYCVDYLDLDWQYNWLSKKFIRGRNRDITFDFEPCYKDATRDMYLTDSDLLDQTVDAKVLTRDEYVKKYHLEEMFEKYKDSLGWGLLYEVK